MLNFSPPPAVICAENIALRYLLHPIPIRPSCNEIEKQPCRQRGYSLTFTRERTLASALAFVFNTDNDSSHIPALCIEENPDWASLNVMLAVNRKKCEDGNEVLQNIKSSLEKIFTIVSEISEDTSQATEHRVFTAIVSMCHQRILSRLRFVAKKWSTPEQPLRVVLSEAINSLKQVDHRILQSLPVNLFIERVKDVMRLADVWAKHQKMAELEDLVEGVYRLKQIGDLQVLLDSIPNRAMCPSSRQNLVNIVSKVSIYRETARFLCRTAKRIPSLRRAKVVLVNLPKEAFSRVQAETYTPQLASTIARIDTVTQRPDVRYLSRLLNMSGPQPNDQFATQTRKTLREAKIHAEIQLIYYYELNASMLMPRVVCSSKDACFLCNAFILMHGKMHTPRYHGRLYPGWRLPSISDPHYLDSRFNSALEDRIKDSLRILLLRQKKTVYPDPNESTLLTLPLSTSTLHTSALVEATERREASGENSSTTDTARLQEHSTRPKDRASASLLKTVESAPSMLGSISAITTEENGFPKMGSSNEPGTQLPARCSHQRIHHKVTPSGNAELIQGMPLVDSIVVACEPRFHVAGPFEIHIEFTTKTTTPDENGNVPEIIYDIEWLSVEKARELLDYEAATVVDVEASQCQTLHTLDSQNDVLIMARGALVRITPRQEKREENGKGRRSEWCEVGPPTMQYRVKILRSRTTAS